LKHEVLGEPGDVSPDFSSEDKFNMQGVLNWKQARAGNPGCNSPNAIDHPGSLFRIGLSLTQGGPVPIIAMFYGIIVRMFFRDNEQHHLPHVHAEFQGDVAVFSILDGTQLEGTMPPAKQKLVVAWIEIHKDELIADWDLAVAGEKIFRIKGLE
jgi:hypothetical protein